MREQMSVVVAGHVDHGKSTLIGRLLYDTKSIPDSKIEEIKKACAEANKKFEFSYILDYLQEERREDMTIDTTRAFFKTGKRDYVIIDTPGHREFTKNMITGASQADAAILIVDASAGVREQTKRHAKFLSMLGVKQLLLVVNKMDLVRYSEEKFNHVKKEGLGFLHSPSVRLTPRCVIPAAAAEGVNLTRKSKKLTWYKGGALVECLDSLESAAESNKHILRFPVQDVYVRDGKKIFAGMIESGQIKKGRDVLVLPEKTHDRVNSIEVFLEDEKKYAKAGENAGITLEVGEGVKRGSILCDADNPPKVSTEIKANIFWLSPKALSDEKKQIRLRSTTQEVDVDRIIIHKRINSSTLDVIEKNAKTLKETEVGEVTLKFKQPLVYDNFNHIPAMGCFVLTRDDNTIAGGTITK